jgi:hypothetical protein
MPNGNSIGVLRWTAATGGDRSQKKDYKDSKRMLQFSSIKIQTIEIMENLWLINFLLLKRPRLFKRFIDQC